MFNVIYGSMLACVLYSVAHVVAFCSPHTRLLADWHALSHRNNKLLRH